MAKGKVGRSPLVWPLLGWSRLIIVPLSPLRLWGELRVLETLLEKAKTVYIYGSAYSAGGTKFAGWGMWSADNADFCISGPLVGRRQSSDRAEVRALVAAVESAEEVVDVVTDNMYVKDTAELIKMGGKARGGPQGFVG